MRPPDHIWRSDGYGWLITLTGDQERTYETTAISCIPDQPLDRIGAAADGTVSYGTDGVPTQTLRRGANGAATLHLMGSASDVDLTPLPTLPASCSHPPPDSPGATFDVFWQTFAENYNSFERKNVNWTALRDRYRPMVDDATKPKQLFKILQEMATPLHDAHVEIEQPNGGESFVGKRPGTRDEDEVSRSDATKSADKYLKRTLDVEDIHDYAKGRISYADLPDGRGYLRITAFEGYGGKPNTFATNSPILGQALDKIFTAGRVASLRGLVIDDRFNTGGDDELALQVAGRLTNSPYLAFRKQPRNDPDDPSKHGRSQAVMVQPAPGVAHYVGPISLLTSDLTVSAGETFVEALLGRTPAPTRIGSTTQGVFSDDMTRTLPNGWTFTLGNEDYTDPAGHDYEGVGIPPTIPTPVFTDEERDNQQDSALSAAVPSTPAPG
jgi:hypothetical protein